MSRSIWKGPFFFKQLSLHNSNFKQDKTIRIWSRNSMVLPDYIGKDIQIYNGKSWTLRKVVEEMVGHKFGEFCPTKKKTVHKVNKIKQVSRKK